MPGRRARPGAARAARPDPPPPRSLSACACESLRPWTPARGHSVAREHEVHGLTNGQDLRGLFIGDLHPVGVLELLNERVQVERVGLQVLLEAGRLGDLAGIDLELVGQVRAYQ